jgi:choline/glycine/proline betaine transport protein
MLFMCVGLYRALQDDWLKINSVQSHNTSVQYVKANMSWQDRLDVLVSQPSHQDAQVFLDTIARPALNEVKDTFIAKNIKAEMILSDERIRLVIGSDEALAFAYGLRIRAHNMMGAELTVENAEQAFYRVEVYLEHGGQQYDVMGYTQSQIIADIVTQYERYLHYLYLSNSSPVAE